MSLFTADLIGLDTETGGLNGYVLMPCGRRVHGAKHYPLIELAFVLPEINENGTLNIEAGRKLVVGIAQSEGDIKRYHEWALKSHTDSGLLERLETGEGFDYVAPNVEVAEQYIIDVITGWGVKAFDRETKTGAVLFGNNISFDFSFLDAQMPKLAAFFHYRKIDVSSVNVLSNSIWSQINLPQPYKQFAHTALSDISESTSELNGYTRHLNGAFS